MVKVAGRFGRYGYRMVTGMLRAEGWVVNHKRVERIWREEGLKVPKKQPKRGRLWLTDGSCIRLRPLYRHHVRADEAALRADVVKVAGRFGRYGYRMVTGMLRAEGWVVNHKRVERIWREEGLKVPKKQPKRGRLWLTDGSCIRLRPLYRHHVWAYDFVADRTHDGRPLKMLTVLDEYSRECLAIVVARRLRADDVLQTLSELFVEHGPPANLRSDNGPEFTAKVVREWLERVEVKTLYIEPGSPWENGYNESFNGTLGEEVLKREIFYSLEEAKVLTEQWRREYNTIRPHSSLRYRPPAPEALRPDPFFLNLPKLNGPHPRLQEAVGLTQ